MILPALPMTRPTVAAVALAVLAAAVGTATKAAEEARFAVTTEPLGPPVGPFMATLGPVGNGIRMIRGGEFEPVIYRNWFPATEDAPDRVIASPADISHRLSLASGALDGADVRILRIENGRFRLVRRDRIPEGGFHASGWVDALPRDLMIDGRRRQYLYGFAPTDRPGVTYHFALRGIGRDGRPGSRSAAVAVAAPATAGPGRAAAGRSTVGPEREGIVNRPAAAPAPVAGGTPPVLRAETMPDGRIAFSWSATGDWAGFVLERSDTDPALHRGYWFALADGVAGPSVQAGDLVVVSKPFFGVSRERDLTYASWGTFRADAFKPRVVEFFPGEDPARDWALRPHAPDTPVPEAGTSYLEVALGPGAETRLGAVTHAGVEQEFYPVLEPGQTYVIEAWLRADRPSTATLKLTGFYQDRLRPFPPVRIGTAWQRHAVTFTPREIFPGRTVGGVTLELRGPGRIDIDNFRMYRADHPYLAVAPTDLRGLRESGMGALRTHGLVKTKTATYDLRQLVATGNGRESLPKYLEAVAASGADLWLQVEPHFAPEEWLGLVEYLAAPFDPAHDDPRRKPWAALRAAQGRAEPWVDAFGHIYLELGNETWNRIMQPWIFEAMTDAATGETHARGTVYGLWHRYVWDILRSSPYWQAADLDRRLTAVIGGQGGAPRYGADAAAASPTAAAGVVTVNAYLGGWEAGADVPDETPESYLRLLTHVLQVGGPNAEAQVAAMHAVARTTGGPPPRLGVYEGGPGYVMDGLNRRRVTQAEAAVQERVMKSVAAGTATLDAFLTRAGLGFGPQTFFTFAAGQRWTSHTVPVRGGLPHPSWILLSLFNREATGTMLGVETLAVPRIDLPAYDRGSKAVPQAPLAAVYATRRDDRLAVIVLSRRVPGLFGAADDGVTRVRIDLPIARAARLREIALSGDFAAHNLSGEAVRIVETVRPLPADVSRLDISDLAPGTVRLFVYDGVGGWRP